MSSIKLPWLLFIEGYRDLRQGHVLNTQHSRWEIGTNLLHGTGDLARLQRREIDYYVQALSSNREKTSSAWFC